MISHRYLVAALVAAAACHAQQSDGLSPVPETPARVAAEMPVAPGDCVEARRRAADKPDLVVDRIPEIISARPPALVRLPANAFRKDGSAEVKVDVVVDTTGRARMKTFRVVSASSPLLVENVRSVIGKWRFEPAQLAGCKVARVYHFMASAPPRKR